MSEESDTEILKKYPVLEAAIDYCLKRIESIIVSLVVAGSIGGCNHLHEVNTEKWVGQHLEQKQQEIENLKGK